MAIGAPKIPYSAPSLMLHIGFEPGGEGRAGLKGERGKEENGGKRQEWARGGAGVAFFSA